LFLPQCELRRYRLRYHSPFMAAVERTPATKTSGPSLPVLILTILGTVIAVLGFLVGGSIAWTTVGLGAVLVAGVIGLLERLIDARERH
jgi:hypothetical protein